MIRSFRSLLVSILALWRGLSQKQVGAKAGLVETSISYHLRKGGLAAEALFERLLAGLQARPAEVAVVTGCLEALEALENETKLTVAERDEVETTILEITRLSRRILTEAALRSRKPPVPDAYPRPADLESARWQAGESWAKLAELSEDRRLAVVRVAGEFQTWALAERVCEESEVQAWRDIERTASLARLAQEIAEQVQGPDGWRNRIQGYALGHVANSLRVPGELEAADAVLEKALRLWDAGSDPDAVLDPGRLLDLQASLRRDQRRFDEALALLEEALRIGRCRERYLLKKGFTLEVMGDYERAVETLLEAQPGVESSGDDRLRASLHQNLALSLTHLGRYREAAKLGRDLRSRSAERGDKIWAIRGVWLEGRIAAGLGRREEALSFLAQARAEFDRRNMSYDVALALLEEAVLLLEEGRAAEVKGLAKEISKVFESKGIHREALVALKLFKDAAEQEAATAELARRVLGYLFRARYDQGLQFTRS
jgi:tetratricopeptide (TPR) repeat protein